MTKALSSHKGRALPIDAQDVLWLSRAVEAEGEPRALVAQTLVNRWAWLLDRNDFAYPRLRDLVQAYAQPVNPRWFDTGDLFQRALAEAPDAERESLIARARKRRIEHSARTTFSPRTIAAVDVALKGPVIIPPGTVHFSAPRTEAHWQALLTRAPERPSENAFYRAENSGGYLYAFETGGPRVWQLAQALESESPIAGIVVAAMGLVSVFALSRRKRR